MFLNVGWQEILRRADESVLLRMTRSPCHSERSEESNSAEC